MIEFERFTVNLGPRASEHTPDQLRQFHVQTQKLVDILLGLRRDGILPFKSSQQTSLDGACADRTLEIEITERGDDTGLSPAHTP